MSYFYRFLGWTILKQKSYLPLILLFFSLSAYAHLGNIQGTVYDKATNLPLRGVTVQLTGLGKAAYTNELGQYRFNGLVAAPYKLDLSHVGFTSVSIEITVQDDRTAFVQTSLATHLGQPERSYGFVITGE